MEGTRKNGGGVGKLKRLGEACTFWYTHDISITRVDEIDAFENFWHWVLLSIAYNK